MKIYWYGDNKNIVGKRVKGARLNHKPAMTQSELAAKLEIDNVKLDRISISRIESGDRFVCDYELLALSKALQVSIDWLLIG